MAKDFPDAGSYAYHPPSVTEEPPMPVVKVVPSMPASQSDRPQVRPVSDD
jgi:hypothetical protein